MKILATADLHYNIARSKEPTEYLARRVLDEGGDALVLVGDSAGTDWDDLRGCLRLFADFPGRKLLVPGNHELWCADGETSIERYETILPSVAAEEGFSVLDHEPVDAGDVGLVGSVGWYDFSLAEPDLGIPMDFYRAKLSPGAARYYGGYEDLLSEHADVLTERHMSIGARWMDGWRVRLGMSDEEFLERLIGRLERQLESLLPHVEQIIAFVHHLPFEGLLPEGRPDRFAFAQAFLGSARIGKVLRACPKVRSVYCGHSHWPNRLTFPDLTVVNIGSTYVSKNLEVIYT